MFLQCIIFCPTDEQQQWRRLIVNLNRTRASLDPGRVETCDTPTSAHRVEHDPMIPAGI